MKYTSILSTLLFLSFCFPFLLLSKGYMAIKNSIGYVDERPTNALGYSTGRPDNTNFISDYGITTESKPKEAFSGVYVRDLPEEDEGNIIYQRTDPYAEEYEF